MHTFTQEVQDRSGQNLNRCFQCRKCTAGCPAASWFEWPNHTMLRMIQHGLKDELLNSRAIWLCMTCETCGTRCPNGIHISPIMDALRAMATEENRQSPEREVIAFHKSFLESVRCYGKAHEGSLLGLYKLRTWHLLTDLTVGIRMFVKGKIPIRPSLVKDRSKIEKLFQDSNVKDHVSVSWPLRAMGLTMGSKKSDKEIKR